METNFENKTPGYILLHRSILDQPYFSDSHYIHLWVYMLLKTNHSDKMHDGTLIKRGSFKTGRKRIAKDTWINENKIERMLNFLESEQQIEQQKTTKYRIISIVDWDKFQKVNNKMNNKQQQTSTSQQQITQLNNNSNYINEINDIKNIWNEFANKNKLSQVLKLSTKRKKGIEARSKEELFSLQTLLDKIEASEFLLGSSGWQVDFDFLFCSESNYLKILEGKYDNRATTKKTKGDINNDKHNAFIAKIEAAERNNESPMLELQ